MSEEELKTQLKKEMISLCETNSSVMTYMECLMKGYEQLQYQLQQKENIIKEVREYLESNDIMKVSKEKETKGSIFCCDKEILEILDKEVN